MISFLFLNLLGFDSYERSFFLAFIIGLMGVGWGGRQIKLVA